jgi:hypothetical protein
MDKFGAKKKGGAKDMEYGLNLFQKSKLRGKKKPSGFRNPATQTPYNVDNALQLGFQ